MNKDIINPSKKTITYAATLSSVVSLLPVEEPDVPYLNRSNGIVSITTTPRKGQWAYGKIPRLFLLYAQTLIKDGSPMVDFENRTIHSFKHLIRSARTRESRPMDNGSR